MKKRVSRSVLSLAAVVSLAFAMRAGAEAVRNGNEMALAVSSAEGVNKANLKKQATGVYHTWRYLQIRKITPPTGEEKFTKLVTVEPSSDMRVVLVTNLKLSLKLAQGLQVGDSVSARGRVKSVGVEDDVTIVVDPAILEFKDRDAPAKGKENLKEVDPRAK